MDNKLVAKFIRRARQRKGLTQIALADLAKIARSQMNRIESGKGEIKGSQILAVAEALGIPPAQLFAEEGQSTSGSAAEIGAPGAAGARLRTWNRYPDIFNDLAHLLEKGGELAENMMRLQLRTLDGILRDSERMTAERLALARRAAQQPSPERTSAGRKHG